MNILFVHQNFPGQFKFLAPELARQGHTVVSLSMRGDLPNISNGVRNITYKVARGSSSAIHPWIADFETKVIRGDACYRAAQDLKQSGFIPQIIIAHPGWGEIF